MADTDKIPDNSELIVAVYDLTKFPTTFDFAAWAVIARTHGCNHVHFIIDGPIAHGKYPEDIAWRRFGNIVIPLCKLARLTYSVGERRTGWEFPYLYGDVKRAYESVGRIERLQPTWVTDDSGYVTITMRQSFRNKYRNSNVEAWRKFGAYLESKGKKVVWLEECEGEPLDLLFRMALYCGAEMNLGASNGPMALCHFSEAPYITLNLIPKVTGEAQYDIGKLMSKQGFGSGSQFGFRNERQILVWEPDDYENIVRAYESMEGNLDSSKEGNRTQGKDKDGKESRDSGEIPEVSEVVVEPERKGLGFEQPRAA